MLFEALRNSLGDEEQGCIKRRHDRRPERRCPVTSSPSETIAKAIEGKNRVQGMVRSIDQYRNGDPKAIADGSYAQILYALIDDKHDILVLWDFAVSTALQLEAIQREMAEKDERIAALQKCILDCLKERDRSSQSPSFTWAQRARTLIQEEKK